MIRVSEDILCPICGKPDWCLVSPDGKAAICSRIQEGSVNNNGAGFLHILDNTYVPAKNFKKQRRWPINWNVIHDGYSRAVTRLYESPDNSVCYHIVMEMLENVGIEFSTLLQFGIGWDGEAFTFPIKNSNLDIIGLMRRFPNGDKRLIKGSGMGLFIPSTFYNQSPCVLVCEGLTDTATGVELNFSSVGRMNCNTGNTELISLLGGCCGTRIVIIADNDPDNAGINGARILAKEFLSCENPYVDVKVIRPPEGIKDLREWKESGLTREKLLDIIRK